jgi:hypothetical protein
MLNVSAMLPVADLTTTIMEPGAARILMRVLPAIVEWRRLPDARRSINPEVNSLPADRA